MSSSTDTWEKKVTAARYIMCGMTQKEVAGLVGVHPSTLSGWTRHPDWSEAMRDANTVEFEEMAARALGVVKESIASGDVKTSQWYLSKVHPVFSGRAFAAGQETLGNAQQSNADLSSLSEQELRRLAAGTFDAEYEEVEDDDE